MPQRPGPIRGRTGAYPPQGGCTYLFGASAWLPLLVHFSCRPTTVQLKHPPMSAFVSHWRVMFCVTLATANIPGTTSQEAGLAELFVEVDVLDLESHAILHHSTNRLLIQSFGGLATDFQPEFQLHAGIGQM